MSSLHHLHAIFSSTSCHQNKENNSIMSKSRRATIARYKSMFLQSYILHSHHFIPTLTDNICIFIPIYNALTFNDIQTSIPYFTNSHLSLSPASPINIPKSTLQPSKIVPSTTFTRPFDYPHTTIRSSSHDRSHLPIRIFTFSTPQKWTNPHHPQRPNNILPTYFIPIHQQKPHAKCHEKRVFPTIASQCTPMQQAQEYIYSTFFPYIIKKCSYTFGNMSEMSYFCGVLIY